MARHALNKVAHDSKQHEPQPSRMAAEAQRQAIGIVRYNIETHERVAAVTLSKQRCDLERDYHSRKPIIGMCKVLFLDGQDLSGGLAQMMCADPV